MKITIGLQGKYQAFDFEPLRVGFDTTVRASGQEEHTVTVQDSNHLAVAFCWSRKAAKYLCGTIRYERPSGLYIGNKCLALGVLFHPKGWPNKQKMVSVFTRLEDDPARPYDAYVPTSAGEVFPTLPDASFAILESIPGSRYEFISYQDVKSSWQQGKRVGLIFKQPQLRAKSDRLTFVAKDANTAEDLKQAIKCAQVEAVRVNEAIRVIIREVHPSPDATQLLIDGIDNLAPEQKHNLQLIGLTPVPGGGLLTRTLNWHHARMLAAVTLF